MWFDDSVRKKNAQTWARFKASWKATFHSELTAGALEKWPTDRPHYFSNAKSTWLTATLRFLKGQAKASSRRRGPREASPAPSPAAKPAARISTKGSRGGEVSVKARNPDPVRSTGRSAIDHTSDYVHYGYYAAYCYYTGCINYANYSYYTNISFLFINYYFLFFFLPSQKKTTPGHRS
jgi:hypothetical protein